MRGEEETIGGGLGAAIFVMPLVFGWIALRSGYHPAVRILVGVYMALSLIPLYLLVSIFWTSGSDVKRMAREFDRNRSVAAQNAGTAKDYMDQYQAGDLGGQRQRPADTERPQTPAGAPVRTTSVALAQQVERDSTTIERLAGHTIIVTGPTSGPPSGRRAYLVGTDMYPAITLEYDGVPPSAGPVSATCSTARMESAGPVLGGCR